MKKDSKIKSAPVRIFSRAKQKAKAKINESRSVSPHRSFRLTSRTEVPKLQALPSWWRLMLRTLGLLQGQRGKVAVLVLLYAPLAWVVTGFYSQNFADFKQALQLLGGSGDGSIFNSFEEAFVLLGGFFSSQGEQLQRDALVILNVVTVLFWLTFLWIARHAIARKATTLKQAVYTSGTAFVPFVIVVLVLVIQLLPGVLAAIILSGVSSNSFVQQPIEIALLALLAMLLIILSLYLIASTLVALQVAALPGMYPWTALRNARKLVMGRRLAVLRKLVMLIIVTAIGWLLLFAPALVADSALCGDDDACWSTAFVLPVYFYVLCGAALAFASVYMYMLYRALLDAEDEAV